MSKLRKIIRGFIKILKKVKTRLKRVFTDYPLIAWGIAGVVFIILVSTSLFLWPRIEAGSRLRKAPAAKLEHAGEVRRAIDGLWVKEDGAPLPFAVVMDNHPDAYPLFGITEANLVFEAPVEGGLTRFLAIFGDGAEVKKIGPVRSARPYFLDWAAEFGAPLIHIGGSLAALERVKSERLLSIDEFGHSKTFWRDGGRVAPHNVFTSSELLEKEARRLFQATSTVFEPWKFTDSSKDEVGEPGRKIVIPFSSDYQARWIFDEKSGKYARLRNGAPELDVSGVKIEAVNVAVLFTRVKIIDEVGRRKIETRGTGEAIVFSAGRAIRGTWRKDGPRLRLRFYDERGQEVAFRPGATWIEVVSKGTKIELDN